MEDNKMYAIQYANTSQYVTTDPAYLIDGTFEFTSDSRAIDQFQTQEEAVAKADSLGIKDYYIVEVFNNNLY